MNQRRFLVTLTVVCVSAFFLFQIPLNRCVPSSFGFGQNGSSPGVESENGPTDFGGRAALWGGTARKERREAGFSGGSGEEEVGHLHDQFRVWIQRYREARDWERPDLVRDGKELGLKRAEVLRRLIPEDPARALRFGLGFGEWSLLPDAVREVVETPFSESVEYRVYPVCGRISDRRSSGSVAQIVRSDGRILRAFAEGLRRDQGSKQEVAVQGIVLGDLAAVRSGVFQEINSEDFSWAAQHFQPARSGLDRSFATGLPAGPGAIRALCGGKIYAFSNRDELEAVERHFEGVDRLPGHRVSSSLLCSYPSVIGEMGQLDPSALAAAAAAVSKEWTTGLKKVFMIRVGFPDSPAAVASKEEVEATLNAGAGGDLVDFSSGKASIEALASSQVYLLGKNKSAYGRPGAAGYEGDSFTSLNDELYDEARAVFLQQKAGADLGVDLESFPIVGVIFPDAGCKNDGWKYAGLASIGGNRLWMQGSNSRKVYVHEFGHLYGLYHSNFWQVANVNAAGADAVVGSGSEKEYGDIFDVMGDGDVPRSHFHPHAKRRLEWFNASQIQDVTESGTYRIYPHDAALAPNAAGLRGLRVAKRNALGPDGYYWVGYRALYGENPSIARGAYMLWQFANAERCGLLDTSPGSAGGKGDAGLEIGRTYSDWLSGVHITPLERGGGGDPWLQVEVRLGDFTLNNPPEVSGGIQGPARCGARVPVQFSAGAQDSEQGRRLAYYWDAGDGTVHENNGLEASTMTHAWVVGGVYTVRLTVSDMHGGLATCEWVVTVDDPVLDLTARNVETVADLSGIAASSGLAVVVDSRGGICTSPDGVSWTQRLVPEKSPNLKFHAVEWSSDARRFVAVGRDCDSASSPWVGVVYASTNGIDWERVYRAPERSGFEGSALLHVTASPGGFVAAGHSGMVLHSPDGVTWSLVNLSTALGVDQIVTGVASGGGIFLLSVHSMEGASILPEAKLYASTDGMVWQNRTSAAQSGGWQFLRRIFYAGDRFFASGMDGKLWSSRDFGVSFSPVLESLGELSAAGYWNGLFFASARIRNESGDSVQNALFSVDGTRWVARPDAEYSNRQGVVFFQDRLLTVGVGGQLWQSKQITDLFNSAPVVDPLNVPVVWARSPVTWTVSARDPEGDPLTYHWDAGPGTSENAGAMFTHTWISGGTHALELTVSDGMGGVSRQTVSVVVRDPFQTFSPVTSGGNADLAGVASSGTLLVAVGEKGEIRSSVDGGSWSACSIANAPNLNFEAVCWGGGRFVAVGGDYSFQSRAWFGVVYTSENGLVWNRVHAVAPSTEIFGSILRAVAFGNGRWVATGYAGTVLGSPDGTNWTAEVLPGVTTKDVVSGVAFGDEKFVAVGHAFSDMAQSGTPRVWTRSGAGWSLQASGGHGLLSWQDFRRIFFLSDRWVAGGFYSKLRTSVDAGVTFSTTRSVEEEMRFAVVSDGVFFVLASDGYLDPGSVVNPIPVGVVSSDGKSWSRLGLPEDLKGARAGTVFGGRVYAVGDGGKIWRTESPLRILRHPVSRSVLQAQNATFSALAAGGGALSYQWYRGETPLPGETGEVLTVRGVTADVAGDYWVMASDESGNAVPSLRATLSVEEPSGVNLIRGLQSVGVLEGGEALLRVECSGPQLPVTYVWRRNGILLPAVTGDTITVSKAGLEDEGWYEVQLSVPEGGSIKRLTSKAYVHVYPFGELGAMERCPFISRHPVGYVLMAGGTLELFTEAVDHPDSSSALTYQWFHDAMELSGQKGPTLRIESAGESENGTYWARVSGGGGSVVSAPAVITILGAREAAVSFFPSPTPGVSRWIGEPFQIKPSLPSGAVAFQWYRNGAAIAGGTGAHLNLPPQKRGGWDRFQLWAAGSDGAGNLSEPIDLETFDYSPWQGTFEGLLVDDEGNTQGRTTVSVSAGGGVSGTFLWKSMVHRFAGSLGSEGTVSGDLRGWPVSGARYVVSCDWARGILEVRLAAASGAMDAFAVCERAIAKQANRLVNVPFVRWFSAECAAGSVKGAFEGYQGALGVGGVRLERFGTVWSWGRMADGGVWSSVSRCRIDGAAVCFARVMNRPGPSSGWIGGVLPILPDSAQASYLGWTRPGAASPARWKLGFSALLKPMFSDYSPVAPAAANRWNKLLQFIVNAQLPEGGEVAFPAVWNPAGLALDSANSTDFFSQVRLRFNRAYGVFEGLSGGARAQGRYRWIGIPMQSLPDGDPTIRGFVSWGEWTAPFECRLQPSP